LFAEDVASGNILNDDATGGVQRFAARGGFVVARLGEKVQERPIKPALRRNLQYARPRVEQLNVAFVRAGYGNCRAQDLVQALIEVASWTRTEIPHLSLDSLFRAFAELA
jgi:hypothetical protein